MDIRQITPNYAVSPQIAVEDVPALVAAGFKTVICNRPDSEVPVTHQEAALKAAVDAAGLAFRSNPVTHGALTPEIILEQRSTYEGSDGPTLAYCASGTRSSIVWALGQAGDMSPDEILTALMQAGYQLEQLRSQLEALSQNPIKPA